MAERNTPRKEGKLIEFAVAASTKIEAGTMVSVNAGGYLIPAADTASTIVVGIAQETVDNTAGADGALSCEVHRGECYQLANSATAAVTQASVGSYVYVEDAVTVALASGPTNDIVAGTCYGVSSSGVWVLID